MLNSIEEINNYPAVILMYPSGASGEFIAQALSDSIDSFAKTSSHWENNSRVIYSDFLGRSLNSGDLVIDLDKVISRANWFLELSTPGMAVILAHSEVTTKNFIPKYLPNLPVVEIVVHCPKSKLFRKLAANAKIPRLNKKYDYDSDPAESSYHATKHIRIEWEDIILTNSQLEFKKITEFLNVIGDPNNFVQLVTDYRQRNQEIINLLNNA
jgi:hypothetical protein